MSDKEKIEDFGEKIGGARKDLFSDKIRSRGLISSDIAGWTEIEKDKYITKKQIWAAPDYKKLVENGMPIRVAYFIKRVHDSLPAKPPVSSLDNYREGYIDVIADIRDRCNALKTENDIKRFYSQLCKDYGLDSYHTRIYGESVSYGCFTNKFRKAAYVDETFYALDREIRKKQFLYTDEQKALSKYNIFKYDGKNVQAGGSNDCLKIIRGSSAYYSYRNDELFADLNNWKENTYFIMGDLNKIYGINFSSEDDAKAFAVEREKELASGIEKIADKSRKTKFRPPQLVGIKRTGEDYRNNRDISGDDMLKEFGFRGGEFGNWETRNDRQHNLNMSYDAFRDLAKALGISDSDISLGGELSIAYGARGHSNAAAHFEPDRNVINLTKMNGAGALGHEWGHALDYYLARNSETKATYLSEKGFRKDSPMYKLMQTIKYRDGRFSDFYSDAKKMDKLHSKTDKGYWASDVELFARAFHCYVLDKLKPDRSDYLCGLAEMSSIDKNSNTVLTYPVGEERRAINEQFDEMIGFLKEKGILHRRENSVEEKRSIETKTSNEFIDKDIHAEQLSFDELIGNDETRVHDIPDVSQEIASGASSDMGQSLFSISQNGEYREYLNNENSIFDLLQVCTSENIPYAALMKCGKEINSDTFAQIQQSENFKFSVDINFDEKTVQLYRVYGRFSEPDRTEANSSIDTYDLDRIKELVTEISNETSDRAIRDKLFNERIENCKADDINFARPKITEKENESGLAASEKSDGLRLKENSSLTEEEILKMADKIQRNESENNIFRKQLDKYFSGSMPSHEVINVCSTPNVLKILNSTAKKVVLYQKDLENAIAESKSGNKNHTQGHGIAKDEIYKLSQAIRNPILILKGNKLNLNSVVLLTDMTNKIGENVLVPISLDRQNGRISNIATLYGKKNLSKYLTDHSSEILAINTKKADMLADTGVQFSQSINDTVIRFDNSITYSLDNVNFPQTDLTKNIQIKETSKLSAASNAVRINEFREKGGRYQAHILYNGKTDWRTVRASDGKLYVTTGSKSAGSLMRHDLTAEQCDRFQNFILDSGKYRVNSPDTVKENITAAVSPMHNITAANISDLKEIDPRKSVLNFTKEERLATEIWARRFFDDIKEKSPFYRAEKGDWREHDQERIPIIFGKDNKVDFQRVRDDIKSGVIFRGICINHDTDWNIQISRKGLEDSVKYGFKHKDNVVYHALYKADEIIKNSVLLDSVISERNNAGKAFGTAYMHKFYGIFKLDEKPYVVKSTIEEFFDGNADTLKRLYNIQDIKIVPIRRIEFTEDRLARSVLNGTDISISDLFQIVKTFDKNFYTNQNLSSEVSKNISKENTPVKIRSFRKQDNTYQAHILFDGKTSWKTVQSKDGKLCVTTGSKSAGSLMRHDLTAEQCDRFQNFMLGGDNGLKTPGTKQSLSTAKPGKKI